MAQRVGAYYYFFPTYNQGRKALWEGIDKAGFPHMGHFPIELQQSKDKQQMFWKMVNGSIFQIVGTDDFDNVMGTGPVGCVFSEYSLQNPKAWDHFRPILVENGGWAIFNFTPRGLNHAHRLYYDNKENPAWFTQLLTADTAIHNGKRIVTDEMIEVERASGMSEAMIQQEFYCDFTASVEGRLIPLEVIEEAALRSYTEHTVLHSPKLLGVDVAEGEVEGDNHAIIKRKGLQAFDLEVCNSRDTMWLANRVSHIIYDWKPDAVFVDAVGVGAGVVARLKELGHKKIIPVKAGFASSDPSQYVNLGIEMWDSCRKWLEEGGAIPDDRKLKEDLSHCVFDYNPRNSIMYAVPKKKIKKEYGYDSPDAAEALVYTFAYPVNPVSGRSEGRNTSDYERNQYDLLRSAR